MTLYQRLSLIVADLQVAMSTAYARDLSTLLSETDQSWTTDGTGEQVIRELLELSNRLNQEAQDLLKISGDVQNRSWTRIDKLGERIDNITKRVDRVDDTLEGIAKKP